MNKASIENGSHLPSGGIFLPEGLYEDLNLPTTLYPGSEIIANAEVRFTIEVPEDILDPVPMVYAHGYLGSEGAYSDLRNATARNGKIAITYDAPRTQDELSEFHPKHRNKPVRLLGQSVWAAMRGSLKAAALYDLPMEEVFDISGHSMGGRSASLAALRHPDYVRTVVLNEAAGLEPHNTLTMLLERVPKFLKNEIRPAQLGLATGSLGYVIRNPFRTLSEGIAVSNCDIRAEVRRLGDLGIKSAIVVGESDNLIPGNRVARYSGEGVADIFAMYDDPRADHLWPQKRPLEVARTMTQLLERLHSDTPATDDNRLVAA